jgi:hypothetical protein
MSNTVEMTPAQIVEKYVVDAEWSILSLKRNENHLQMTQSGEDVFIANCAMWFYRNREDFVHLVTLMTTMEDTINNK